MCLIIDANVAAKVFSSQAPDDFKPIIDWLTPKKGGKLVIGGDLSRELNKIESASRFIRSLLQAGVARQFPGDIIDKEKLKVVNKCKSDDHHIIALARISGARLLCSHDKNLHADFTNPKIISNPRGHVYQEKKHVALLRRYGHTSACKKAMAVITR